MSRKVGAVADLQIVDNGKGVLIVIDAVDADGVKTQWPAGAAVPTLAEVDPAGAPGPSFDTSAAAAPTATGFSFTCPVLQPPPQPLVSGITFNVTVASGFPNQTAPETKTTGAVDIVPGPASDFVVTESAA